MDAIYISNDSFSVLTDRTGEFVPGRRLKIDCGVDGTVYATVVSSSFSSPTTTITIKDGEITTNITSVLYGVLSPGSTGSVPDHTHDGAEGSGGSISAAASFTDLTDTPTTYSGSEGKYLRVTSSGIEFVDVTIASGTGSGASSFLDLSDTPSSYSSGLYAKSTGSGIVWSNESLGLYRAKEYEITLAGNDGTPLAYSVNVTISGASETFTANAFTGDTFAYSETGQLNPMYWKDLSPSEMLSAYGCSVSFANNDYQIENTVNTFSFELLDGNFKLVGDFDIRLNVSEIVDSYESSSGFSFYVYSADGKNARIKLNESSANTLGRGYAINGGTLTGATTVTLPITLRFVRTGSTLYGYSNHTGSWASVFTQSSWSSAPVYTQSSLYKNNSVYCKWVFDDFEVAYGYMVDYTTGTENINSNAKLAELLAEDVNNSSGYTAISAGNTVVITGKAQGADYNVYPSVGSDDLRIRVLHSSTVPTLAEIAGIDTLESNKTIRVNATATGYELYDPWQYTRQRTVLSFGTTLSGGDYWKYKIDADQYLFSTDINDNFYEVSGHLWSNDYASAIMLDDGFRFALSPSDGTYLSIVSRSYMVGDYSVTLHIDYISVGTVAGAGVEIKLADSGGDLGYLKAGYSSGNKFYSDFSGTVVESSRSNTRCAIRFVRAGSTISMYYDDGLVGVFNFHASKVVNSNPHTVRIGFYGGASRSTTLYADVNRIESSAASYSFAPTFSAELSDIVEACASRIHSTSGLVTSVSGTDIIIESNPYGLFSVYDLYGNASVSPSSFYFAGSIDSLHDIPTPSANQVLRRNATDDGYEWADAIVPDGRLNGELRLVTPGYGEVYSASFDDAYVEYEYKTDVSSGIITDLVVTSSGIRDLTGNTTIGTVMENITTSNGNFVFNGTNGSMVLDEIMPYIAASDAYTFHARIKFPITNDGVQRGVFAMNDSSGGNIGILFWYGDLQISLYSDHRNNAGYVSNGTYDISVVYDGTTSNNKVYVNGVLGTSFTWNQTLSASNLVAVGQEYDSGPTKTNFFAGEAIGSIKMYNRALTIDEINSIIEEDNRSIYDLHDFIESNISDAINSLDNYASYTAYRHIKFKRLLLDNPTITTINNLEYTYTHRDISYDVIPSDNTPTAGQVLRKNMDNDGYEWVTLSLDDGTFGSY